MCKHHLTKSLREKESKRETKHTWVGNERACGYNGNRPFFGSYVIILCYLWFDLSGVTMDLPSLTGVSLNSDEQRLTFFTWVIFTLPVWKRLQWMCWISAQQKINVNKPWAKNILIFWCWPNLIMESCEISYRNHRGDLSKQTVKYLLSPV